MLLFIIAIVLLIIFGYFIKSVFTRFSLSERLVAYFLSISAYIILSLEIAGLIEQLNRPLQFLLIQILIAACIFLLLRKKILKPNLIHIQKTVKNYFESVAVFAKKHPFLLLYFGIISAGYAFLFFLSVHFPQNTTDVLYNHLSRIGYWLQQGSLKRYSGFNNIGITYPYNNSLLMLWPIIFIRNDVFVGLVQLFATASTTITIYLLAIELGFPKRNSFFSALVFLTFPIILLQSITAQNDLLAAAYISAAFYFLLKFLRKNSIVYLILSALALGLALGTKQYAVFILPGYMILLMIAVIKNKENQSQINHCLGKFNNSIYIFSRIV